MQFLKDKFLLGTMENKEQQGVNMKRILFVNACT